MSEDIICPRCHGKMKTVIFSLKVPEMVGFKAWFLKNQNITLQINDLDKWKRYSGCECGMMVIFPETENDNLQEKINDAFIPLVEAGVIDCPQCGENMEVIQLMPPLSSWRCQKCKIILPGISGTKRKGGYVI